MTTENGKTFSPLKASLLALALFAGAAGACAAEATAPDTIVVAQADDSQGADPQRVQAVQEFLAGGQDLSGMNAKRLSKRLNQAQRLQGTPGLPPELEQALQQEIARIETEISQRGNADATGGQTGEQQDGGGQEKPKKKAVQEQTDQAQPDQAQTGQAQPDQAAQDSGQGSAEIDAFLQSVRQPAELDDSALRQQVSKAIELARSGGASGAQMKQLRQVIRDGRQAIQAGKAGTGQNSGKDAANGDAGTQQGGQVSGSQQGAPAQNDQGATSQESAAIDAFLQSVRPAGELDEASLRRQVRQAAQYLKSGNPTSEQKQQLRRIFKDGREALQSGANGNNAAGNNSAAGNGAAAAAQPGTQQDGTQSAGQQSAGQQNAGEAGQGLAEIDAFLKSVRPASELDEQSLRRQVRQAAQYLKSDRASSAQKQQLRQVFKDGRQALQSGAVGTNQQPGKTPDASSSQQAGSNQDAAANQQTGNAQTTGNGQSAGTAQNTGNGQAAGSAQNTGGQSAAADQQAQTYLDTSISGMNKKQLRQRLQGMRDLLQANQLSPDMKAKLRQRLAQDRQVLRNEVAAPENDQTLSPGQDGAAGNTAAQSGSGSNAATQSGTATATDGSSATVNNTTVNNNTVNNNTTVNNSTVINQQTVQVVLNDKRPPRELSDDELEHRIDVYREVMDDPDYRDLDRSNIQVVLQQNRLALRQRLIENRRQRETRLRANRNDINIDLSLNFEPDRPKPPRYVYAAEADEEDLVDVLSAPPRRKIERRYSVQEVEQNPDLRDAVARIELDTVHFGFGESFLREEEVDKLDRIAEVMEKILAKSPGEVFMIEGHTDAVGSDQANLQLSRARAKAVKEALSTYYVIPAENLETVGYGEKYLKIPTTEPEAENRRVSIARITPLVGELDR